MTIRQSYFFCGIGGSGMMPLALILAGKGWRVCGSDRGYHRGDTPEKFAALVGAGIRLYPQDGSGVTSDIGVVVVSSAVEDSVPDVRAARELGIPIRKRAEVLAELFNASGQRIAVAGTSGKSSVTGMIAVILEEYGLDPTVMNGGLMRNFGSGMRLGQGDIFLTETDESDGSIALFNPSVAILNNIALDHKPLEELNVLFGDFIARADKAAIVNIDNPLVSKLVQKSKARPVTFSIQGRDADLQAEDIRASGDHIAFTVRDKDSGEEFPVRLNVMGAHNAANALAALGAARALGLPLEKSIRALEKFKGIARRLEIAGSRGGVTAIDDFAHNPDKIAASLKTLKSAPGRLIVIFQPHGYGPLKLTGVAMAGVFANLLDAGDMLLMPEPYYAGGTAVRSVTSGDIVRMAENQGVNAKSFERREDILPFIAPILRQGDRVLVMGARDDSLSAFANAILNLV